MVVIPKSTLHSNLTPAVSLDEKYKFTLILIESIHALCYILIKNKTLYKIEIKKTIICVLSIMCETIIRK